MDGQQLDDFGCLVPLQQQLFQAEEGRFYADWLWLLVSCAGRFMGGFARPRFTFLMDALESAPSGVQ